MDRIIKIKLFDQAYTFKANAQVFHAEKIANYVVEQVEKAGASAAAHSKLDTVILAALNIASDYFEMKRCREKLFEDIDQRCKVLVEYIDANA
ncbi:MAG: cell division protein ZapA [Desulfobacterales bacterium]|nr:cell division protein ZapA [Desulfobacterales bacterium]